MDLSELDITRLFLEGYFFFFHEGKSRKVSLQILKAAYEGISFFHFNIL